MFRVEIKEDVVLSKNNPVKRVHLYHFNYSDEVNRFLEDIKNEYSVIKDKGDRFTYFDYKQNCPMNVSVVSCKNMDIPKLKANQVWVKLFSNISCLREAAIFEFLDMGQLENFIDRRRKQGNFYEIKGLDLGLVYFENKTREVVYARKAVKEG